MDSAKFKNYIIIMLVMVNLFLLSIVVMDRNEKMELQRKAQADIREVYANRGIEIETPLDLSKPSQYVMTHDSEMELSAVKALLGEVEADSPGGVISYYTGENGSATFRSMGQFEVTFADGAHPMSDDPVGQTLKILSLLGIEGDADGARVESGVSVTTMRTTCMWCGLPVWRSDVAATFINGSLVRIDGFRLLDIITEQVSEEGLDVITILIKFLELIAGSESEIEKIIEISRGYISISTAAGDSRLDPAWRIETDKGTFFLDGLTGKRLVIAEY